MSHIEAMRQALEALETGKPMFDAYWGGDQFEKALKSLRQAIAEAEKQEPVAWRELLREARDNCKASIVEAGISASRKEYRIDLEARLTAALNASPPQRQWVGLTDDEFQMIYDMGRTPAGMMEMVEAKLKEKNT